MRRRIDFLICLGVAAVMGCGSSGTVITDPSQLRPQTEEEIKVSKELDEKISEEEGNAYGKKPAKAARASK